MHVSYKTEMDTVIMRCGFKHISCDLPESAIKKIKNVCNSEQAVNVAEYCNKKQIVAQIISQKSSIKQPSYKDELHVSL